TYIKIKRYNSQNSRFELDIVEIVSDFDMPELNGIDFYKLLRLEDKLTPFIIFSSKSQEEITFCHPMSDSIVFLQKQTNLKQVFKELVSIIRSVME
ncbi:hypothetical protein DLD82_16770, partial [Methanospirillum stamsii]